jgi:S1-C subfamily serine protease
MPENELHLTPQGGTRSGEDISVSGDKTSIGRAESCDITLEDEEISREHAEIRRTGSGDFEVADLGSRNGVFVNGQRISEPTGLKAGDELRVGETTLSVSGGGARTQVGGGQTRLAGAGVTRMASAPAPILLTGNSGPGAGKEVALEGDAVVIGREPDCDLVLDDDEVSRHHAEIRRTAGGAEIRDLGSRNGTWVDGTRISGPTPLRGGETVKVGRTSFDAKGEGAPTTPLTAAAGGTPQQPIQKPQTPSGVQRQKIQESANRSMIIAAAAIVIALLVAGLAIAGVFSGDDGDEGSSVVLARDVVRDVTPSTVLVNAYEGGKRAGNGSGWVYNADQGLIVTNAHVVEGGSRFEVGVGNELRRAYVVGVSPCDDLALLRTNRHANLKTMALGSQSQIKLGDRAFVIGFPGNASLEDELVVTEGAVSVVKTRPDLVGAVDPNAITFPNVVQLDATINPGNSGGPSVNEKRQLIGVNTFTIGIEDQNFAIGVDQVKKVVPQLARGDSIGYGGFGLDALSEEDAAQLGIPVLGLIVTSVLPNSTADQVGLTPGSLVLGVGGQRVETKQDYCNAVQNVESGETVPLELIGPNGQETVRIPFE